MSDKNKNSVTDESEVEPSAAEDTSATEPDYKAQWLRAMADYRNLQRETESQKTAWAQFAAADLVTQLLPVLNNFSAAISHVPSEQQKEPWVIGIFHIQRQLLDILKAAGVEPIATVGQPFNPEMHEAVGQQPSDDVSEDVIITEVQPGYTLNGKVIAPAKVIVSSGSH